MTPKIKTALFLLLCLPLSIFTTHKEYFVKAVLLQKISRYITWPEKSGMSDTSKSFVIGVIGKNPFGSILEDSYSSGKWKIKKKKVKIKYFASPGEIKECHLLFISKSEKKNLSNILSFIKNKPVLVVGDTKGFAQKGVHINFYQSGKKLRFEINPIAAQEALLSIDPSLLPSGKIIKLIKRKEKKK